MEILFISNIPSPYFVSYLNELGKYANVMAIFEKKSFAHRDKSWRQFDAKYFKTIILKGINCGKTKVLAPSALKYIEKYKSGKIVITNPFTPTGILCITYCKLRKIEFMFQSEGGIPRSGKGIKEHFKRLNLSGAKLYLTGMKPEHDYFTFYGAPLEKVKQYPFSSLHKNDLLTHPLMDCEKEKIKKKLGVQGKRIVLYVGRMIYGKGIDILLKSLRGIPDDVCLMLVGGTSTSEYDTLIKENNLHNIFFIQHLQLEELKDYYLAADLFVLPTRSDTWGLVVNEAMSFGLPVITTRNCVAGTELIVDGENGFLVDSEDYYEMNRKISKLINEPELRAKISKNNILKISDYTYEKMAHIIYGYLSEG